jgi:hypothetical protein
MGHIDTCMNFYSYFDDAATFKPFSRFQAGGANLAGFGSLLNERMQQHNLTHTWTVSPTTINEFRLTYQRERNVRGGQPGQPTFPEVRVDFTDGTYTYIGTEYSSHANKLNQDIVQLSDDVTVIDGHHRIHALKLLGCKKIPVVLIDYRSPDVVVLATGVVPFIPEIPGIDRDNVVLAEEVLAGKAQVGDRVVVVGGELVGCETAEFLADAGKKVTITRRGKL